MTFFTKLFGRFGKAPQADTAPPVAVHVSPEQPVAPELSPRDALNAPPPAGE